MDEQQRLQALVLAQQWQLREQASWAAVGRHFAQQAPRVAWQTDHLVVEFPQDCYAFYKDHKTYRCNGDAATRESGKLWVQTCQEDEICLVFSPASGGRVEIRLGRVNADVWGFFPGGQQIYLPPALARPICEALLSACAALQ